jgi:predicted RNA polymerase sigma factor
LIEQVFRGEWGRVLASLVDPLGDIDLAEEAAQEAFASAAYLLYVFVIALIVYLVYAL